MTQLFPLPVSSSRVLTDKERERERYGMIGRPPEKPVEKSYGIFHVVIDRAWCL